LLGRYPKAVSTEHPVNITTGFASVLRYQMKKVLVIHKAKA
jgi:hypothetical protein